MSGLVFMDTETTGLSLDDDVWDFAAIVRASTGDVEVQFFIEHDLEKAAQLPESFRADHDRRYDPARAYSPAAAAVAIASLTKGAHIVGAVPNFDTERLALLLRANDLRPAWHYHLIDVETLAVGAMAGRWAQAHACSAETGMAVEDGPFSIPLPWNSDVLSAAYGVTPPTGDRHTAIGDARWCRDLYDAVMRGVPA